MRIKKRVLQKIISVLSSGLLLINSFSPYLLVAPVLVNQVKAQEATVAPTQEPTVVPTQEVTPTDTVTPTTEITPSETVTPEPTLTPTVDATVTPTVDVSPTVEVTPVETIVPSEPSTLTPTEAPSVTSPPQTTVSPTGETTPTPTPAIMSLKTDGHVDTTVIESFSCRADLLNACLSTDKQDYAPSSVAVISGYGFLPTTIYTLIVSTDGLSQTFNITTDNKGAFTYSYTLYTEYHASYLVQLKDQSGILVAATTFTDSALPSNTKLNQWKTVPSGSWITGALNSPNSDYLEGETVPFELDMGTLSTGGNPYTFSICRDYQNGPFGYISLKPFDTSRPAVPDGSGTFPSASSLAGAWPAGTFKGRNISSISYTEVGGQGGCNAGQRETQLSVNVISGSTNTYLLWGGKLAAPGQDGVTVGNGASSYPGGSLHMHLLSPNRDVGIQTNAIIGFSTITIHKVTSPAGGTGFGFTTTGGLTPSTFILNDAQNTSYIIVVSGTYTVVENDPAGAGYSLTGLTCGTVTGTGTSATPTLGSRTVSITIGAGGSGNVDCVYTNTLQSGHLIVHKVTDPASDTTTQFSITASGNGNIGSPATRSIVGGSSVDYTVDAGTYSVSEASLAGWDKTGNNCTGIAIANGETKECTVTNTKLGNVTVVKYNDHNANGVRDVGDELLDGWEIHLSQMSQFTGANGQVTFSDLQPGTFTLSEQIEGNWFQSNISCTPSGTYDSSNHTYSFTVSPGGTITCSIGNYQNNVPSLHLRKTITNDNGGTAAAIDWTLTATGASGSPTNLSGSTPVDSGVTFKADTYTLGESGPANYTPGSWDCGEATKPDATHVTVPLGGNVTCTINNNDNAPGLHLRKTITNDNGGTALNTAWTLTATGTGGSPTNLSDSTPVDSGATFKADTYTLAESGGPSGYTPSAWNCVGGSMPDATHVTVALGQSATCTINNNDNAPSLTLDKFVVNDFGSSAVGSAWTLTASGTGGGGSAGVVTHFVTTPTFGWQTHEDTLTTCDGSTSSTSLNNNSGDYFTVDNTSLPSFDNVTSVDYCAIGQGTLTAGFSNSSGSYGTFTGQSGAESCFPVAKANLPDPSDNHSIWNVTPIYAFFGGAADTNSSTDCLYVKIHTSTSAPTLSGPGPTVVSGPDFKADTYTLGESGGPSGYTPSSWSCVKNGEGQSGSSITLGLGDIATCTIINTAQPAGLIVKKVVVNDNGGTKKASDFSFQVNGDGPTSFTTVDDTHGENDLTVNAGTYNITEPAVTDYSTTYDNCSHVVIANGGTATCTITNTRDTGTIHGYKWGDTNGDGLPNEFGNLLEGWTINLYKGNGEGYDLINTMQTSSGSENFGWYWFEHLVPGDYKVCEVLQDGWTQTFPGGDGCHYFSLPNDQVQTKNTILAPEYNFGNQQQINPELQISKFNDAAGDRSVGDSVIYTLTLSDLNNGLTNVVLKDLLPKGFLFQNVISIIKTDVSSVSTDITSLVGDPHYASPGTYNLGGMTAGDVIVIKYLAKIDNSIKPGLYKDIAWAVGTDTSANRVLALAQPEGYVALNFSGTAVNVNANLTTNGSVNILQEGQVLGASTSLPATGASSIWLILASILSVAGFVLMILGVILKKKNTLFSKVLTGLFLLFVFVSLSGKVEAATNLSIRLSQPKSPTAVNNFNATFVTLDLSSSPSPITVKCYKKGPSDGGFSQFGSDIPISAGGNTDNCVVDGSVMSSNGTYQFYATANNGSETATSVDEGLISVDFNTSNGPTTPSNYVKDHISSCQYKITFTTANDGKTVRVEIYRSDSTSFNLDSGTLVTSISIGPNQNGSYTDTVPDCNKTWYYVIRAFDSLGNGSGTIGDTATSTTTTTTTTTTTSSTTNSTTGGAIPVSNVNLPGGTGSAGSVLGQASGEGQVKGAEITATPSGKLEIINVNKPTGRVIGAFNYVKTHKKIVLGVVLGLGIIGYGVYYFIKKRKESPQV